MKQARGPGIHGAGRGGVIREVGRHPLDILYDFYSFF